MIRNIITRIFGSRNARVLKGMQKTIDRINELENGVAKLSAIEFPP